MSFEEELSRLERSLEVPYPERAAIVEELAGILDAAYRQSRGEGLSEEAARSAALQQLRLDDEALDALASIHLPPTQRALSRLPRSVSGWIEPLAAVLPLVLLGVFLLGQVAAIQLLREGGLAGPLVVAVGTLAWVLQLQRAFGWFVIRDHSKASLARRDALPLYLAAAALLQGLLGTVSNVYRVLGREGGQLPADALLAGVRESLAPLILGSALAALVVITQGALNAGLRALRVPVHR